MAPNRKVGQACKAVAEFGIPAAKVKAALKELLKVYDNQWEFIEDDNYRLLIDFLLENKPDKNEPVESKAKAPQSKVEAKERSKKRVPSKLENNRGNELVHTKRLRTRRHKNSGSQWLITLDTHLQPEIPPSTQNECSDHDSLPSELEDSGLIRKRSRRKWEQQDEDEHSQTCWMNKEEKLSELCVVDKQTISHAVLYPQMSGNNAKRPNLYQTFQTAGKNEPSYGRTGTGHTYTFAGKKSKTLVLSVTPWEEEGYAMEKSCMAIEDRWADHFFRPGDADNVLDLYHNPLNHPTEEPCSCSALHAPSKQCCGVESPCEKCSKIERDELKDLPREFLHKETKVSNGTMTNEAQFDIASFLKGEVKISLIHDSSKQPHFSVPCLDDVLKMADEKCRELYNITESGFTSKLMMEVCHCFLAMGTGPVNTVSSCEKPYPQVHPTANGYFRCESGISPRLSMETFNIQNRFKLVPGIPRHPFHTRFDNIHCFVSFRTNYAERDLLEHRGIKLLRSCSFPLITLENMGVSKSFEYAVDINDGLESSKSSLANGSSAKFFCTNDLVCKKYRVKIEPFLISDLETCLRNGMDCLSSLVLHDDARKTWRKCSYELEILVKKELLNEWISVNRGSEEAEERSFPSCKKLKLSCRNGKILNLCSSDLAGIFTNMHGNSVNLQIEGSDEKTEERVSGAV